MRIDGRHMWFVSTNWLGVVARVLLTVCLKALASEPTASASKVQALTRALRVEALATASRLWPRLYHWLKHRSLLLCLDLQDGDGHIQSPAHCNASLSQPSLTAPQLCAEFTVVGHSSAVSTFHQNWPRQTWFPLLSSCRLELTS